MPPPAPGGHITHARALRWAHLFNLRYRLLLDCLHHSLLSDIATYETSGAQQGDSTTKGMLQLWTFSEMRRLKVIAEKLVELPAGAAPASRAGPPFELPYSMRMPHIDADRWAMHADVFAMAAEFISGEMLVRRGDRRRAFSLPWRSQIARPPASRPRSLMASRCPRISMGRISRRSPASSTSPCGDSPSGRRTGRSGATPRMRDMIDSSRVMPGDPAGSVLLNRIALGQAETNGMPKERPRIAPERVAYISDWIARGAPDNVPPGMIGMTAEPVPPREPATP